MHKGQLRQLIKIHIEEGEFECRWCFAIDMQRVKGELIATYNFPDATLVHLSCPRCGGEFTMHIQAWGQDYLRNIICKLHPELEGGIDDKLLHEVNERVYPEYLEG